MDEAPTVTALLGPTNTGKTHRALERMLEHESGAIGVPLRLLARELYDRLSAQVGERRVALITGEEKRVPARPRYWVCTVEAMPPDLVVDFLAIDEVQLAAHDQRGHVFTDRLLHARGRKETWFLGADTIAPLCRQLVPEARITRLPRLSVLSHVPPTTLSQVPRRSAVIAFSVEKVFEFAERLRARRGGAAVVLGVLSPRTRNAQVAMYEAGEVDWLVATDAIGMGLNLDVRHVAFAALHKFDGREARPLDAAEVGQIAGRAGRHKVDGTFGAIEPRALPLDVVRAVESHRFPTLPRLLWRNANLDFGGASDLIQSLRMRPPNEWLRLAPEAEDLQALLALAGVPEIAARADTEARLRLLWDVCRVPDYRKLLFESHVALLAELYEQLLTGAIAEPFLESRLAELDREEADIDTLTARLSAVRTYSYIANQSGWLLRPRHYQERTRDLEDRLSDSLHKKLIERFVDSKRNRAAPQQRAKTTAPLDRRHPFAQLAALRSTLAASDEAAAVDWTEALVDADHSGFELDDIGRVWFAGRAVARLVRGRALLTPNIRLLEDEALRPGIRARILRRLSAYVCDVVDELVGPLRALVRSLSPAGRGLLYQLEHGLGTVLTADARPQIDALTDEDQAALDSVGVRLGERTTYVLPLQRPDALARRALLVALDRPAPPPPHPGALSFGVDARFERSIYTTMGFPAFGRRAVRADVAEAVHVALQTDAPPDEARLLQLLGCPKRDLPRTLAALSDRG